MFFHEFGEHGILALELGFELLDLLVLGVLDGLGGTAVVEGGVAVLEEFLEPVVDLSGKQFVLLAQGGHGNLLDQVLLEDGDFLNAGKMTTRLPHDEPPFGLH